ncbi:hypothetical protein [uncultured Shewanella sp.]|uniref:glycosyl hydrolase family 18 protein n=1 Tax=uncultured Shewanella sp. TaxID=173975 RepID=UPI002617F021|nr:hypothetical protein [uncultured Shewanella sp.]
MLISLNKPIHFLFLIIILLISGCDSAKTTSEDDINEANYLLSGSLTPNVFSADGLTESLLTIKAVSVGNTSITISPSDSANNLAFFSPRKDTPCIIDSTRDHCSLYVIAKKNSSTENITGHINFTVSDNSNVEKLNYTISHSDSNLISASLSPSDLASDQTAELTITTSDFQSYPLTVTVFDSYGLITFTNSNTCIIEALARQCTIAVNTSTVTKTQMGHLSFTLSGDNEDNYPNGINDVSYAIYPITNKQPYTLAFWPNYSGYNNRNTTVEEASSEAAKEDGNCGSKFTTNIFDITGNFIPQASYNMPGIKIKASNLGEDIGYPACDKAIETTNNTHNGYTNNHHFTALSELVDAISYAFLKPTSNGYAVFDDPWTDLSNDDFMTDKMCHSDMSGHSICNDVVINGNNCEDAVCYGSFSAFINLQNNAGTLEKWVTIGGEDYKDIMYYLVSEDNTNISDQNISNFINGLTNLALHGLDGVNLNIEFYSNDTWTDNLLFQALARNKDNNNISNQNGRNLITEIINKTGLKVSISLPAFPDMILYLMGNDPSGQASGFNFIDSWLDQGLSHLNFMTYGYHSIADASKGDNYTGFNTALFPQPTNSEEKNPFNEYTDPIDNINYDLSVNAVTQYINGHDGAAPHWNKLDNIQLSLIQIGLPTYARAYTGIGKADNASDVTRNVSNNGLFNSIQYANTLPGDQDNLRCTINKNNLEENCDGLYSYNYIHLNMTSHEYTSTLTPLWNVTEWIYDDPISKLTFNIATSAYQSSAFMPNTALPVFGTNADDEAITALNVSSFWNEDHSQYNNFQYNFISYASADVAKSYGAYSAQRGLGGAVIWLMSGELNITDNNQKKDALIYNFIDGYNNGLN